MSLETLHLAADPPADAGRRVIATGLAQLCAVAEQELLRENRPGIRSSLELSAEAERLRWFVLPQEVSAELDGGSMKWPARQNSNLRPLPPEGSALSS